jgi:hypothetical protein
MNYLTNHLSRTEILSIYLRNVLGHAVLGAILTWGLLVLTFGIVAHVESLPFEWIPAGGFTWMCVGVGAFIGGGAGVEPAQILTYDLNRQRKAEISRRAAEEVYENPFA